MWPTTTEIPTEPAGRHGVSSYKANDECCEMDDGVDDGADYAMKNMNTVLCEEVKVTKRKGTKKGRG